VKKQAQVQKKSGNWVDLGSIRESEDGEKQFVVLNKNVTVLVDGEEVDLGQYRTVKLIDPRKGLETSLQNERINQEKYEQQMNYINEKRVIFKLTVPPQS
jgi:hypothetical protein